ncbi:glyoxalase [Nocardioides panacisoli]|uniref:Glyoxalase n=1 Tax=Nocardioides panacisoli TaxID=627624 RepID=A0ABP7I7R7_9ACTN
MISSIVLEAADAAAAEVFYKSAFGLGDRLAVRQGESPSSGFRGFTLSLVVAQPADVDLHVGDAVDAGATVLKPAAKSMWGYGGVVQAPDGAIWKIATSSKKNTAEPTREVTDVVLLIGVSSVGATKRFYTEHGFEVARSFGPMYAELDPEGGAVKLALYGRKALAKDAGVPVAGDGSHRLTIRTDKDGFTDPDGFVWESAPA